MNRVLKSVLNTAAEILDQPERSAARIRDRIQDRAERIAHRAACRKNHTLLSAVNLAAGIGIGVGLGMLLAPASGAETRRYLSRKSEELGDSVRDLLTPEMESAGSV